MVEYNYNILKIFFRVITLIKISIYVIIYYLKHGVNIYSYNLDKDTLSVSIYVIIFYHILKHVVNLLYIYNNDKDFQYMV